MRSHRLRPLLAAALVGSCGCSFIAVRRPPPSPVAPDAQLECTQSRVAPALDTAGAIGTPIVGFAMWGLCTFTSAMQSWSSDPSHLKCGHVLWGTILSTAAYTGSAVYGYHVTGDCRRLAEQRRTTAPGPGTLGARMAPADAADAEHPRAPRNGTHVRGPYDLSATGHVAGSRVDLRPEVLSGR